MEVDNELIVLYDGSCGFCSRTVQFVLKNGDSRILFSPLGSDISMEIFSHNGMEDPDMETFYFVEMGRLYQRSRAAFNLAKYLRAPYRLMSVFRFIPKQLTDPFYSLVARNRKRIAGESCLLPTPEDKKRFIN